MKSIPGFAMQMLKNLSLRGHPTWKMAVDWIPRFGRLCVLLGMMLCFPKVQAQNGSRSSNWSAWQCVYGAGNGGGIDVRYQRDTFAWTTWNWQFRNRYNERISFNFSYVRYDGGRSWTSVSIDPYSTSPSGLFGSASGKNYPDVRITKVEFHGQGNENQKLQQTQQAQQQEEALQQQQAALQQQQLEFQQRQQELEQQRQQLQEQLDREKAEYRRKERAIYARGVSKANADIAAGQAASRAVQQIGQVLMNQMQQKEAQDEEDQLRQQEQEAEQELEQKQAEIEQQQRELKEKYQQQTAQIRRNQRLYYRPVSAPVYRPVSPSTRVYTPPIVPQAPPPPEPAKPLFKLSSFLGGGNSNEPPTDQSTSSFSPPERLGDFLSPSQAAPAQTGSGNSGNMDSVYDAVLGQTAPAAQSKATSNSSQNLNALYDSILGSSSPTQNLNNLYDSILSSPSR